MYSGKKVGVVIPAAGSGSRFGGSIAKQFFPLHGKSIIEWTLSRFQEHPAIDAIAVAGSESGIGVIQEMICRTHSTKVIWVGVGGIHRQDSVWNAFQALQAVNAELILVHDCVRPFVTGELVDRILQAVVEHAAVIPAIRPNDTVKICTADMFVQSTPPRDHTMLIQTPQAFRSDLLLRGFERAKETHFIGTDDASLVEHAGIAVKIISGSNDNIKITTREDLEAANIIARRFYID